MTPFVVVLILISAAMHAGWNLLARRQREETIFFARMLAVVALVGLLPATISEIMTRSLPPTAWLCVAGSGVCLGLYFWFLARAYGSSEFTVVYPVARALPILFIALCDVVRGHMPSPLGWVGVVLVTAGCFLAPLHSLRDFTVGKYFNRASLWMLLAAAGSVGVTLLDKIASEVVQPGPATAARYGYVLYATACVVYLISMRGTKTREKIATNWITPAFCACLTFGGYWLILWAFQMVPRASYVFAFRQFSIVIAVVLAFMLYRERGLVVRIAGALLITAGCVLIGGWG